ncbi:MAG: U32 family peptidase [Rikenellaceae bacterium]|nr:U32 family peptidase [Rikenellaceae bacterium]MCL2691960.1 U32 family peptidase [Rikenellaceae bacterium]
MKKLELLSPARTLDAGKLAVDYGADALYVGGPSFGARAAATNSVENVGRLVECARPFGVRVYAALNTLVFEDEITEAERVARELITAGVDALIVQDMAFLRMGLGNGVEFHASTQMCNATPEHVRFLQEAGFSRVILERGLTLAEIAEIGAAADGVELEAFVHGAICVGFSGRCYLSRTMSPTRSGNRGDCMQACRLTYDLVDGGGRKVLNNRYLLSPLDLDLSARLGDLIGAGVTSFKIEGRLKDDGYVKNVVAHYRAALDRFIAASGGVFRRTSAGEGCCDFVPDPAQSFTRGGSEWFLDGGRRGQVSFDTPKAMGELLGEIEWAGRESFRITGAPDMRAGDGICFMANGELCGTYINKVCGREVWPERMDGITVGATIHRNYNKAFDDTLSRSRVRRRIDTDAEITVACDGLVSLCLADSEGVSICASAMMSAEPARDPARMREMLRTAVSKSGDTIFDIRNVTIRDEGELPFMPVSAINEMRRTATDALLAARLSIPPSRSSTQARENLAVLYPSTHLGGEANVTNSLAERFYREHGVTHIDKAFDLRSSLDGRCVMTSSYCLRRELGECLRERPSLNGDLFLHRGRMVYRLEFDCAACRMRLIKEHTK